MTASAVTGQAAMTLLLTVCGTNSNASSSLKALQVFLFVYLSADTVDCLCSLETLIGSFSQILHPFKLLNLAHALQ